MSQPELTDEQKAEKQKQYEEFCRQLKKDLGIEDIVKTLDHMLAFNSPKTEADKQLSSRVTPEEKKKLMDADDAIDFLDKLGSILQKYNIIESGPTDPYLKMQSVFASSYMDLLGWQARENMKDWQKMKYDKEHKT